MRNFSEFEKKAIKKITEKEFSDTNVLDLLSDIALNEHRGIHIDFENKKLTAIIKPTDSLFFNELVESVFLIKYLEKESLIFFHSNYEPPSKGDYLKHKTSLINSDTSKAYTKNEFSTTIFDDIVNFQKTYFVCSTELIEYVKNDFKSLEQIRHEENLKESEKNLVIAKQSLDKSDTGLELSRLSIKKATLAIFISIALGLISIFSSFYFAHKQSDNEIKIDQKQFELMRNKIELIETNIDSINFYVKKIKVPDTITSKIVNVPKIKTAGNNVYTK